MRSSPLALQMMVGPLLFAAAACTADDPAPAIPDGAARLDGFSWDWNAQDWWQPPSGDLTPGDAGAEGPAPTTASVVTPVEVKGAACSSGWQDTGSTVTGGGCQVHLGSVQLGAGGGAEPDRFGCKLDSAGSGLWAYLFETGCDDKDKIGLRCTGSCGGGSDVTRGAVEVTGQVGCKDGWRATGTNLGPGKTCAAFLAYAQIGVGSGPEPDALGCRYDAATGDVEAYLYEKDCDDKAKIALRCEWICSAGAAASAGKVSTTVASQCSAMWMELGSSVGAGRTCVAGMSYLKLGVGSGPEPDLFGCRFNSKTGKVEAQLREISCDDKSVKLDCGYLCFN